MSRKNLYDILNELEFSGAKEYERLTELVKKEKCCFSDGRNKTLYQYINDKYFRFNVFRGTFISLSEMWDTLTPYYWSMDDLFILCELLLLVLDVRCYHLKCFDNFDAETQARIVIQNIITICEKTNHCIVEQEEGKKIIVEKNAAATQAVQLVDNLSVSSGILEYLHYALKGHLEEKRKILLLLGNYIEPMLKSHVLKNAGYGDIESDVGFLLNNMNIRHNNLEGTKRKEYTASLTKDELEEWYDKTYNTILAAIILKEQIAISAEIKPLRS